MPQIPECRDHTRLSRWLQPSEQASNRLWDGVRGNYEVRLRKRTYGVSDTEVYTAYEDRHTSKPSQEISQLFNSLADEWWANTAHLSLVSQKVIDRRYQRIISLGRKVVPLILERLARQPADWFWALRAITGDDPVKPQDAGHFQAMQEAWLNWGRERGLLR